MPQGAWTEKRERQYDHIKSNLKKRWLGIFRTADALFGVMPSSGHLGRPYE